MELFALRYMTRFSCLGPTCEDNCCQRWLVTVDKEHYDRLRGKMSSPEERAEFDAKVKPFGQKTRKDRYAMTVLRDDKSCSFLDENRLCTIHSRYGEELLFDTCAIYPRVMTRIGQRVELTGSPSCPAVSRAVLFEEDALDIVPEHPKSSYRYISTSVDHTKSREPMDAHYEPLRGLLLGLLRNAKFPVGSRLFFVAYFAAKTRDILVLGRRPFDRESLQDIGSSLEEDENLVSLHKSFGRVLVDPTFAISVARALLGIPKHLMLPKLVELVSELEDIPDPAALPPLPKALAQRLETLSGRLVLHDVVRLRFTKELSFLLFYHHVLARTAAFRYLVATLARRRGIVEPAELDELAVRAAYLIARSLEHNASVERAVRNELERHGMTLEHAAGLIRL